MDLYTRASKPALYALYSRLLGVLLIAAAALKLYGLKVDPVAQSGMFSAPALQFLIVAFEVLLGGWLLSDMVPAGSWLVALVTFIGFSAVSFSQGWIGQASCGCFGKVTVNPWIIFTVDLVAVAGLIFIRPDLSPLRHARLGPTAAGLLGGYLVLLGSFAAYAHYRYGSIDAALASLRDERLSVSPGVADMGIGEPGESRVTKIDLANRTDGPIRVIGGTSDCSCTVLGDLPVTIPSGESHSISITVRLPNAPGAFNRTAELTIDDQGFKKVGFRLTGRIIEKSE